MAFLKASLKHKWKLFFCAYILILVTSIFSISYEAENSVNIDVIKNSNSEASVLYFRDEIVFNNVFLKDLEKNFNLIVIVGEKSFNEISETALSIIDSVGVPLVHIIGEGTGGLAAIHFASEFQEVSKSLTLISSNGVVEKELLGGYHLNRALYGIKLSFFKFLKYGVPHFGSFPNLETRISRSSVQYKSDQRNIRQLLKNISIPTLLIHSDEGRTSQEITKEHVRLVPGSTFLEISSSYIKNVISFIQRADNQKGDQYIISELRQIQSLLPFDASNGVRAEGKGLIILMFVIILSTLISEDLTCIGTGLMIARGLIGFFPGVLACLIGIFVGDILLYVAGRWLAKSALEKAPLKWFITEKDIQKSYYWFEAKGPAIIIASRFIPGTRFPTYFSAGAIGASFLTFILYFGIASIIWTPVLVGLSVLLGQEMISYFTLYQEYVLWVVIGTIFGAYVLFKFILPTFTYRGRRTLIGKWKRLTSWEFWPPYFVYFFVLIYTIGLWIKHKSITVCTLANPSIPEGGVIKESKKEILDGFKNEYSIAKYILLKSDYSEIQKQELIDQFITENELSFPIVIKPDVGERGKGVSILKNVEEVKELIPKLDTDHILQEFIDGEEFGVFYYRLPSKEKGEVFSITRKKYLALLGDGKHTLEHLILKDSRAVCMAELHLDQHYDHLYNIPEEGRVIKLVELGTHSRGALFFDANHLITDSLVKEIDRISKSFNGFYFGRYDIKVPSEESLKKGAHIQVIELNGLTSESTNIYDPKHSFFFGVKTLTKQWKIAYQIGSEVKMQNPDLKASSLTHILSLLR